MKRRVRIGVKMNGVIPLGKGSLLILAVFNLILSMCKVGNTFLYRQLVDQIMIRGRFHILYGVMGGFLLLFLCRYFTSQAEVVSRNRIMNRLKIDLQKLIFRKIMSRNRGILEKGEPAEYNEIVSRDAECVTSFWQNQILGYFFTLLNMAVILAASLTVHVGLTVISGLFLLLACFQTGRMRNKSEENHKALWGAKIRASGEIGAAFPYCNEIKIFQAQDQWKIDFAERRKEVSDFVYRQRILDYINYYFSILNNSLISDLFIYVAGGILVIFQGLSIGSFLIFLEFYRSLLGFAKQLLDYEMGYMEQYTQMEKILPFLEKEDENIWKENGDLVTVSESVHLIELQNLDFGYAGGLKIFFNYSRSFRKGSCYWLLGKSGAGKSTLLSLLTGERKAQGGSILINGREINTIKEEELLSLFCMQSKKMKIFNTTLRDNLLCARPDAGYEELMVACQKAGLRETIISMEKGLDSRTGENGSKLSGGQRQRLLLARAFLSKSRILILDEMTSEMELSMEKRIMNAVKREGYDMVFVVSHRDLQDDAFEKVIFE